MSETDFSRLENQMLGKPKDPAIPQFYVEPVKLEFRSKQEGRPIFEDREMVKIIIPGDRRAIASEPVSDVHKERWPEAYAAFKAGREAPLEGTPLGEWPVSLMTPSRVQELAHFHIRTVEQLAGLNDVQLQQLGMGARELRERAKTWLEVAAKGAAPIERLIAKTEQQAVEIVRLNTKVSELGAENDRLRSHIKDLESRHVPPAA